MGNNKKVFGYNTEMTAHLSDRPMEVPLYIK